MLTDEQRADGWIEHDGGPCPVPLDSQPHIMWNNGSISRGDSARLWTFSAGRSGDDFWKGIPGTRIIAYRLERTMHSDPKFLLGDFVEKVSGAQWRGRIVGFYSTELTPEGYAVESVFETGSVQIYPAAALRAREETP